MAKKTKFTIPIREDADQDADERHVQAAEELRRQRQERKQQAGSWVTPTTFRLAMLCTMLGLVIWAMNHASRPESWNWLFKFDRVNLQDEANESSELPVADLPLSNTFRQPDSNEPASSTSELETEASPQPPSPPGQQADSPSAETSNQSDGPRESKLKFVVTDDHQQTEIAFWRQLLEELDGTQQSRLFNLMDAAVHQRPLHGGGTASVTPLYRQMLRMRQQFHADIPDNQELTLAKIKAWERLCFPALKAVVDDRVSPKFTNESVRQLHQFLTTAANELIRDKTAVSRPREAFAWFAAWDDVFEQPLEQEIDETATVTQLLAQPEAWRGKYLRIEGTAMRIERISATFNALGIDRYYVIWIRPDHPSSFPYCVYTFSAPESLLGDPSEKMRVVNQRVSTTARFFKNRLFSAGEAAYAPVLLTGTVEIPDVATAPRTFRLPSTNVVLLTLLVIASFAGFLAITVYRSTLGRKMRALPQSEQLSGDFKGLQGDERVQTTAEKLKKLEYRSAQQPPDSDDLDES